MRRLDTRPTAFPPLDTDFSPVFSPQFLRYALASTGTYIPAPGKGYAYCELGMGAGAHTVALGCLLPGSSLWGIEENPSAVLAAHDLLQRTGCDSVILAPMSLARFLEADTPAFDCIVLRERYASLSPEERKTVQRIAERKLKCGGVFALSYEAMPTAAGFTALVTLLRDLWEKAPGKLEEKLDWTLEKLEAVKETGQGLFRGNAPLAEQCRMLCRMNRVELLWRYLSPCFAPAWFEELSTGLADGGVLFSGCIDYIHRIRTIGLSEEAVAISETMPTAELRETICNFLTAPLWRHDIFMKGQSLPPQGALESVLFDTPVHAVSSREEFRETIQTPRGEFRLDMETHNPVYETLLTGGPASARELSTPPEGSETGMPLEAVSDTVSLRVALGDFLPVIRPETATEAERENREAVVGERVQRYNMALLERSVNANIFVALLSPLGSVKNVNPVEALFCLALAGHEDPLETASALIEAQIRAAGRESEGDALNRKQALARQYEHFSAVTAPELRRLGIISA